MWHGVARHLLRHQHSLAAQAGDSIPDVNIVSDHELVLVLDELRQSRHLRASTVDRYARVVYSLTNKRDIIWINWSWTEH